MAVDCIKRTNIPRSAIFTDSYSTIQALSNIRNRHPYIRNLIHEIHNLKIRNILIEICWVPSHVGILGNIIADQKAVEASRKPVEHIPIFFGDLSGEILNRFRSKAETLWRNSNEKLTLVKKNTEPWPTPKTITRKQEVIVNRLRLGHCYFSHSYLLNTHTHGQPPECPLCNDAILSVKHLFLECTQITEIRQSLYGGPAQPTPTLEKLLG